jgi:hypothetical protein
VAAVHRFTKPLVFLVVIAQLLLAVPAQALTVASMTAPTAGASSMASMPCDDCPCCPDGVDSMTDCLVSCTLAAAATMQIPLASSSSPRIRAAATPAVSLARISQPPLKPPPIA